MMAQKTADQAEGAWPAAETKGEVKNLVPQSGTDVNNFLDIGLKYLALGWSVVPIVPGHKFPHKGEQWKPLQEKKLSPEQLAEWFTRHPDAHIGQVTGKISGDVIIDLDTPEAIEAFDHRYPGARNTIRAKTGKGEHLYYRYPPRVARIKTSAGLLAPDTDMRAEGGIVILPPSLHKSGKQYSWQGINPLEHGLDDMLDLPPDLLADILATDRDGGGLTISSTPGTPATGGAGQDIVELARACPRASATTPVRGLRGISRISTGAISTRSCPTF